MTAKAPVGRHPSVSGCLTCRRRRKKCPEQKPICIACQRNSLICIWPAEIESENSQYDRTDLQTSRNQSHGLLTLVVPPTASLSTKPAILTNSSEAHLLFQHFIESTALRLSVRPAPHNPYLTHLVPLAMSQESVLHAVLAISASHLSFGNKSVEYQTRSHYAIALRNAKYQVTELAEGRKDNILTFLTLLLTLCQFECVDGNMHGAVLHHLGAIRHLLKQVLPQLSKVDSTWQVFLLEQYSYLAIVGQNMCFTTEPLSQTIDHTVDLSLHQLDLTIGKSDMFGFMFGCSRHLYSLIPRISRLAKLRVGQESRIFDPPLDTDIEYESLQTEIRGWQPSSTLLEDLYNQDLAIAASMYQQALLIFLHTAKHGTREADSKLLGLISPCTTQFMLLFQQLSVSSAVWTTLMWPTIIAGSCLIDPILRSQTEIKLNGLDHSMYSPAKVLRVLQWVWEDEGFGSFGLAQSMKKRNVKLSLG